MHFSHSWGCWALHTLLHFFHHIIVSHSRSSWIPCVERSSAASAKKKGKILLIFLVIEKVFIRLPRSIAAWGRENVIYFPFFYAAFRCCLTRHARYVCFSHLTLTSLSSSKSFVLLLWAFFRILSLFNVIYSNFLNFFCFLCCATSSQQLAMMIWLNMREAQRVESERVLVLKQNGALRCMQKITMKIRRKLNYAKSGNYEDRVQHGKRERERERRCKSYA